MERDLERISILLPDLRGGGAERVCLDLARQFALLGHLTEFLLMRAEGDFLAEVAGEYPIVDLQAPRARHALPALVLHLRRNPPDALLVAMWPLTVIAPLAARIAGFRGRVVISEHGILSAQYAKWGLPHRLALRASMAVGYRMADARVGVSNGVAQDMAALAAMDAGHMTPIYNPMRSLPAPSPEALALANSWWGGGEERILTVGALKPVKNHSLLLRAFAATARPAARLMLLGCGDGEADLRSLAAELRIADRVIFAGFYSDPTPFYHTANLFVLSSDYEGFGNVIVEALSCGLPVVSTDCPSGPAEILQNGQFGRLVPTGDAEALARAMDEALSSPVNRHELKARAANFAPGIAANRYLELLRMP